MIKWLRNPYDYDDESILLSVDTSTRTLWFTASDLDEALHVASRASRYPRVLIFSPAPGLPILEAVFEFGERRVPVADNAS